MVLSHQKRAFVIESYFPEKVICKRVWKLFQAKFEQERTLQNSTITKISKRFREDYTINHRSGIGRKSVAAPAKGEEVKQAIMTNHWLSVRRITQQINLSPAITI